MKKKIIYTIMILSLLSPLIISAQNRDGVLVLDPSLQATIEILGEKEVQTQQDIHEDQERTADFQATIAVMQNKVKRIEEKTYKYLSTASSLIETARYIVDMRNDISKTFDYLDEAVQIVADEPYLLLTTVEIDTLIYRRITELLEYVTNIAFVWDFGDGDSHEGATIISTNTDAPKNLLNNAERMEIVYHVSNELKIIRGYANYLKYHLQTAKKQTLFQNLCPYTYQMIRNCEGVANNIINTFSL